MILDVDYCYPGDVEKKHLLEFTTAIPLDFNHCRPDAWYERHITEPIKPITGMSVVEASWK